MYHVTRMAGRLAIMKFFQNPGSTGHCIKIPHSKDTRIKHTIRENGEETTIRSCLLCSFNLA